MVLFCIQKWFLYVIAVKNFLSTFIFKCTAENKLCDQQKLDLYMFVRQDNWTKWTVFINEKE